MSRNNTNEPNRLVGAAVGVATPKKKTAMGTSYGRQPHFLVHHS
jgi:pyruvoyl-dependent arginine decarboxylase (PvlArgDC)